MKTVILMRHSQPDKTKGLPNEMIPLTKEGVRRAQMLFDRELFSGVERVYSSPYQRAFDTAALLGKKVECNACLIERLLGDEAAMDEAFWERQYLDPYFRNLNGESLNEAGERIAGFMNELLTRMRDGEKTLVVSHAAAICGFLMRYCDVSVTNAEKKLRRITFGGKIVLDGKIGTPGAFVMEFDIDRLIGIRYTD